MIDRETLTETLYETRYLAFPETRFFVRDFNTLRSNVYESQLPKAVSFTIYYIGFAMGTWLRPELMWPLMNRGIATLQILDKQCGEFPLTSLVVGYPQSKKQKPLNNLGFQLPVPLTLIEQEPFHLTILWIPEPRRIKQLVGKVTFTGLKVRPT